VAPVSFLLFCEVTRVVLRSDDNFLLVETQIEKETRIGWYGWNQRSRERERLFSCGLRPRKRTRSREVSAVWRTQHSTRVLSDRSPRTVGPRLSIFVVDSAEVERRCALTPIFSQLESRLFSRQFSPMRLFLTNTSE
jgi:hypothetical protein